MGPHILAGLRPGTRGRGGPRTEEGRRAPNEYPYSSAPGGQAARW